MSTVANMRIENGGIYPYFHLIYTNGKDKVHGSSLL